MRAAIKFFVFCILEFCLPFLLEANARLELDDRNKIYKIDNTVFTSFADTSGNMSFPQVTELEDIFKPSKTKYFKNENSKTAYWYKFKVKNNSDFINNWLIISYNYSIKEIDLYVVDKNGDLTLQPHEEKTSLSERLIYHKQPAFYLDLRQGEEATIYLRTIHTSSADYEFVIYSNFYFSSYFFKEYFGYGMFYGILAFLAVFGLISYFLLSDKKQFMLVGLIIAQAIYMLFRDGNGLLFLIPNHPDLCELMKNITKALFTISLILYCIVCLQLKKDDILSKIMLGLVVLRIILLFATLYNPDIYIRIYEFGTITFCLFVSHLRSKDSRGGVSLLTLGFGVLWLSFLPYFLNFIGLIEHKPYMFFALYYGILFELMFFMIATGGNIKQLRRQAIDQEQVNKELEKKVLERTESLENQKKQVLQRSKEMNDFLYLASHDIKGPIRSIKGLSELGIEDEENKNQYFHRIKATSETLSNCISDLIHFIKTENTSELKLEKIDLSLLHNEIGENLEGLPNFKKIKISTNFKAGESLLSDKKLFSSIYQNLLENAINYLDPSKDSSNLMVSISKLDDEIQLTFKDNGLGISLDSKNKVFDMFYKNSKMKESSGLGLYIVKASINKLGGSIKLESKPGEGSTFVVSLPIGN